MPFGFPALEKKEYEVIKKWLAQGAPAPTSAEIAPSKTPSQNAQKLIVEFEEFLNKRDAKHVMSARYIYEHLFFISYRF